MRARWDRWVAWLTVPESATAMALFRVGVGVAVLADVALALHGGIVDDVWLGPAHGGIMPVGANWLVQLIGGTTPAVIHGLLAAVAVGGVALVVGAGGRLVAFATLQAALAVLDSNSNAGGSYDELLFNALWLLVLAGGTQTLSVDARLRSGAWAPRATIGRWARFLVMFQLVLMYTSTGWQKLSVHWMPGGGSTALYYILQQPTWQRADMTWLAWEPWYTLTRIGTAATWWWEVCAPLWLLAWIWSLDAEPAGRAARWARRLRVREAYAVVGLVFHVAVLATLEVGPFSVVSLAWYAAVVHPWEWDRLVRRGSDSRDAGGSPVPVG